MSSLVIWEMGYLAACFLLGAVLMLLYDALRIGRLVVPHHRIVTGAEDLLYWLVVAVSTFLKLYEGNDGIIRWYAVAAIAIGMLLFYCCISRFLVPFAGKVLRFPLEIIRKVLKSFYKKVTIKIKKVKAGWFHGRTEVEKEKKE